MRLLGLDPGLRYTGWGIIEAAENRLSHVANGRIAPDTAAPLAVRLAQLHAGLTAIIEKFTPAEAAVEETFVSLNAASTLKLGHARGVVLLAPAQAGLAVAEYPATLIKKSIVGNGHAQKHQVSAMVRMLLPGCELTSEDASDALAAAICHAHFRATARRWTDSAAGLRPAGAPQ